MTTRPRPPRAVFCPCGRFLCRSPAPARDRTELRCPDCRRWGPVRAFALARLEEFRPEGRDR